VCSNHDKAAIPKSWILLDSQSTVDIFSNKKLITNIRESKRVLMLHCNAGKVSVTQKGDIRGYGTVWYYPGGIANILSLYNVQKRHRITFDSADGTRFTVHKEDRSTHVFKPSKRGLFYSDVKSDVVLINTVDSIKNKYTVKEYSDACKARSIQDIIGRPSTKDFIQYVENNMLPNCPINKSDILRAEEILGPNLGSLKGKTTRKTPSRVNIMALDDVPDELL